MTRFRISALLTLCALVAACGDEQADRTAITTEEPILAPPADPAPAPAAPAAMAETAPLSPIGDSGVAGEVTVRDRGTQAEVLVRLTGTAGGTAHPGHIHAGSCDSIGPVVQPLERITTDATGAGTATATVDIPARTVMDGQHIVVYHGEGGAPITCAPIPAHAM